MLLYLLVIILAGVSLYYQYSVKSTFAKYSQIANSRGYSGADVARILLEQNGITDVSVEPIAGTLTDHYDPVNKKVCLSQPVFASASLSALAVAAHETGHAIQHHVNYTPLSIRSSLFPIVNLSQYVAMPLFIFGILIMNIIRTPFLAMIGAFLFLFVVLFQMITLPVEFNASYRALEELEKYSFVSPSEKDGCKKVLKAAAMTYVAAAATAVVQLLRLLAIIGSGRRR